MVDSTDLWPSANPCGIACKKKVVIHLKFNLVKSDIIEGTDWECSFITLDVFIF